MYCEKTYISILFLFLIYGYGDCLKCQEQRCTECSERELNGITREVTCNVRNLVTTEWLGTPMVPLPNPPNVEPEFACMKLTASNPNIIGDSTDIIKGCIIYKGAEHQCKLFGGIEVSRGKRNAKCDYCHSDNCNGSPLVFVSLLCILGNLIMIFLNK